MQIELPGEPVEKTLPAFAEFYDFHDVRAYQLWGTKRELRESTRMLSEFFPEADMKVLGDAHWIGQEAKGDSTVDVFILTVLRKK